MASSVILRIFPLLLALSPIRICSGGIFYIGATFDQNKKLNTAILEYAVKTANEKILSQSDIELKYTVEFLEYGNEFMASESVCRLLESMNLVIIGPKSPAVSAHINSICDVKEIPYVDTYMDVDTKSSNINLYPSQSTLSKLLTTVVNRSEWIDFTVLYEAPFYIKHIAPILEERSSRGIVTVQPLLVGTNYRNILRRIKDMGSRSSNLIIACSIEHLTEILEKSLQVGLFTPDRNIIITNLDAQTIDLEPFQFTGANMTLFRVIDPDRPIQEHKNIEDVLNTEKVKCDDYNNCTPEDIEELSPILLQTNTALIYDAVMIIAEALKQIGYEHLDLNAMDKISCYDSQSAWIKGYTLTNFIKSSNFSGLTGRVEFDSIGIRSDVEIDVLSLDSNGLTRRAYFKPDNNTLTFVKNEKEIAIDTSDLPIDQMKFTVITSLVDPYAMLKDTSTGLIGNDRFEGFGIDVINELSALYGFEYEFVLQDDKYYGSCIDKDTNTWNGMIGKVMSGEADLAITDLTINSDRITALDFTPSFMNLGIALLYKKPSQEPPSTFSFMSPFSSVVWIYLGAAYITVSLCFFCLGRISPSQWENRYPCVEEPTFLENQFTLNNSMWFAAGAILQQGSEIEPKAASIRVASSVWWFFTLIMVSSYTANLAAFLVIENKSSKIDSVEDLKDCGIEGKECPVQFGAKKGGATLSFFQNSTNPIYQQMYKYMMDNPSLLTDDNDAGIQRVYDGIEDYAFIMESSSIEYTIERKCNLTQVGSKLDDKNYGIGIKKNFKYQPQLSEGILRLQETGILATLKTKWWKQRKGGGACAVEGDDGQAVPIDISNVIGVFYVLIGGMVFATLYALATFSLDILRQSRRLKKDEGGDAQELGMDNLKGVFFVLAFGSMFACIYGCSEALAIIYRASKRHKISFKEEFIAEVKFLLMCQGVKEVRHRKNSSKSQISGASNQSNQSRYSSNSQVDGNNDAE